jgi:hypothetical protein
MKSFRTGKYNSYKKRTVITVFIFIIFVFLSGMGISRFESYREDQGTVLANSALKKALLTCYAVEGSYPADIDYLKEHYYLNIDENKYYVTYNSIGSNIMPEINVTEKK